MSEASGKQLSAIVDEPDLGIIGNWARFCTGIPHIDPGCIRQALEHMCSQRYLPRLFEEATENERKGKSYSASMIEEFMIKAKDGKEHNMRIFLAVGEGYERRCLGTLRCAYQNGMFLEETDVLRFDGVRPRDPKN